jgi:hypothetical protein
MLAAEARLPWPTTKRMHVDECNLLPHHMIATEQVKGKAHAERERAAARPRLRERF